MREFSKISPAVWQSQRFNSLPSDDGRYLYLYLLSNRHQNSAGCYMLPDGYACTDLGWEPDRYQAARRMLVDADMIHFDAETSELMIARWFKHNPPMNQSHYDGTERILERLDSPEIAEAALGALRDSWESIQAERVAKTQKGQKPAHGPPNGSGGPLPERFQTAYMQGRRQ